MIRIARKEDMDSIMAIVTETIEDLQKEGNPQWSDDYPNRDNFLTDIENNDLYIYETDCEVSGFICINHTEDTAYENVNWHKDSQAIVIHRFAVKRNKQKQKIGTKLIEFAEKFARNKKYNYIKVDTNSKNSRMNLLFRKLNFVYVGQITLRGLDVKFNCYDKILD